MADATNDGSLQPALEKAAAELVRHLDQACDAKPDGQLGSVDELLQLEEELLAAARAADEAVRLKRRLEERESDAEVQTPRRNATPAGSRENGEARVREFADEHGRGWRVWEVRPGLGRPLTELHRYLGDFVHGWLAFSSLDDDRRKRLAHFPPDWMEMDDASLKGLLERASDVARRDGSATVGR